MTAYLSASRMTPHPHQREDTESLVQQPFYFITSEMRTGKTKIVIDAAQLLFVAGIIDRVIVIAPEPVRSVWADPDTGQLAAHLWHSVHAKITEFHAKTKQWVWAHGEHARNPQFKWIITNYEYMRPYRTKNAPKANDGVLRTLLKYCGPKTLIVFDESSAVTSHKANTYKACLKLRRACGRVVCMDGTPMDTPINLFATCNLLHPSILDCKYITHFRARYARMGGFRIGAVKKRNPKTGAVTFEGGRATQVLEWINLDDLQRRMAPYTVRRLQKDCLAHVPKKRESVTLYATMTADEWDIYRRMRDDMIVLLNDGNASIAQQTITKLMRLSQITGGFLGGIEDSGLNDTMCLLCDGSTEYCLMCGGSGVITGATPLASSIKEVGRAKMDSCLTLTDRLLVADPNLKVIVWCRFMPEVERMIREVSRRFPTMIVAGLHGGQNRRVRNDVKRLLHPDTAPPGPVYVVATLGTGAVGMDFSAAHTNVNYSYNHSLRKFLQSGDRMFGPGQVSEISYYDLIARGPRGQRTYDEVIVQARRMKQDLATFTSDAWVKALTEDAQDEPFNLLTRDGVLA